MNLFNRSVANTPADPSSSLGSSDTLPAGGSFGDRITAGGNAALTRASDIYKKNPKVIGGLALVAGALLLNRMKAR